MVIVLNKNAFKLPRVDREKFISLMRLGLDYNRDQGVFSIKSYNNIEKAMEAISSILGGSEVVFLQSCIRCGKDFPCTNCNYIELCNTKNLPFSCVCPQCLRDRKQFEEYLEKF
ncbi:MAG: hypothetical protein NWE98_11900 [Candidatus Bathyarchaeota archaeon]|nr:hypothetical protein [Candidatus Bathyarchaeota archaeon]